MCEKSKDSGLKKIITKKQQLASIPVRPSFTESVGLESKIYNQTEMKIHNISNDLTKENFEHIRLDGNNIRDICFSTDGQYLSYGDFEGNLYIYNTKNWKKVKTIIAHNENIQAVTFSPDGHTLATCTNKFVKLWECNSWKEVAKFKNVDSLGIRNVSFSSDSKYILFVGFYQLTVWSFDTSTRISIIKYNHAFCNAIFFSNDKEIISSCENGEIIIWSLKNSEIKSKHQAHPKLLTEMSVGLCISPDSGIISSVIPDGEIQKIKFFNKFDFHLIQTIEIPSPSGSMSFSCDGKYFAAGGLCTLSIWETTNWNCLFYELISKEKYCGGICFSPDNKYIAVSADNALIYKLS